MSFFPLNKNNLKKYSINKSDVISIIVLLSFFLVLLIITWQKWGNPVIDCGRDLYVAEQILKGNALYTDIYYVYGPLVPYIYITLFLIFGIHLNVAYLTGILTALISALTLYLISRTLLSPFISVLTIAICLPLFIFKTNIANYIFPYTYSVTFGTLFCLILILLLSLHLKEHKPLYLYVSGALAGLSIITKLEFIYISAGILVLYLFFSGFFNIKINLKVKIITIITMLIIPIAAFLLILQQSGLDQLQEYYNYSKTAFSSPGEIYFIENLFGLNKFPGRLLIMLITGLVTGFLIIISNLIVYISVKAGINKRISNYILVTIYIAVLLLIFLYLSTMPQFLALEFYKQVREYVRVIFILTPFICFFITIYFIYKKLWKSKNLTYKDQVILILSVFVILSSLKTFFNSDIFGYGVYYFPVFFLISAYLLTKLYGILSEKYKDSEQFKQHWKTSIVFIIGFFVCVHLNLDFVGYGTMNYPITTERGTIKTSEIYAIPINKLIKHINEYTSKKDSILLLPEESLIYFLTDRKSPSKFYDYLPFRLSDSLMEVYLIDSIIEKDVKLIAISSRNTAEYLYPRWGTDYNQRVYDFILINYSLCAEYGDFVNAIKNYGIRVYQQDCKKSDF